MNVNLDNFRHQLPQFVKIALDEDVGDGDITAALIPESTEAKATVITREDCVVCGQAWVNEVFSQVGGVNSPSWHVEEGQHVAANTNLFTVEGLARGILTAERTALNFLQLLSGIATKSNAYRTRLKDKNIRILDTRKTIPGLRLAQKYAVSVGGCDNHRIGLYDAFLIKENHIAAAGGIHLAVTHAKALYPDKPIIVEVETIDELKQAIEAKVDRVMLDNFSAEQKLQAFALDKKGVLYEASGNVDLDNIHELEAEGIDCISIGDLTKNIQCIDLSMRFTQE